MRKQRGMLWLLMSLAVVFLLNGCAALVEQGGDTRVPALSEYSGTDASQPADTATQPGDWELSDAAQLCVRFIDVGQADCALLECDGHYMLIDGGNRADSSRVYSVLQALEVSHLDMVVGTHVHEDHIGGIPGAFQYATADMTLSPVTEYSTTTFENFAEYAKTNGGGLTVPQAGDSFPLGSATVTVLGVNSGEDTNDTSIVMKVVLGDVSFLFTGDAERPAEQVMMDTGVDLSATVLKVGHHGSDSSTAYPFLRQVMPLYGVISVGKDNEYGHPTREVLERLEAAEVDVLRTDELGDIIFYTDGQTIRWVSGKNAASVCSGQQGLPSTGEVDAAVIVSVPDPISDLKQTNMVWISEIGSKYHSDAGCSGMKNPSEVTLELAISRGYDPCKRCC